jgi:hypothetical protein
LRTWLNLSDDSERFRRNAQAPFELGLRRDGAIVDPGAPNYLFCVLGPAEADGLVAFAWSIMYFIHRQTGVHALEWEFEGIVTLDRTNFTAEICSSPLR